MKVWGNIKKKSGKIRVCMLVLFICMDWVLEGAGGVSCGAAEMGSQDRLSGQIVENQAEMKSQGEPSGQIEENQEAETDKQAKEPEENAEPKWEGDRIYCVALGDSIAKGYAGKGQEDLKAEFVAPRLWMDEHTADGGFMSTSEKDREYAMWRAYRSIDIANELGTDMIVLWLAREGTVCAESKSPVWATKMLIEAINRMLEYDPKIRVCIEPKPNEPIDRSICGTMGHVLAISAATIDPSRVGGNLESAHAILAGLDPAHEIGFALAMNKLMTVHLNDQNGIRYDQDKSFGVENLRAAFNQVKVLKENGYGDNGEYVGLDVKAMRTTKDEDGYKHLENSLKIFKALEEKVDRFDYEFQKKCVENRDFEGLEMYVMNLLMGVE